MVTGMKMGRGFFNAPYVDACGEQVIQSFHQIPRFHLFEAAIWAT